MADWRVCSRPVRLETCIGVQMINVHLPTTDGRELALTRDSNPTRRCDEDASNRPFYSLAG